MFVSYFAHFILCFFHILLISFQYYCNNLFLFILLGCQKRLKSLLAKSFLKKSKDGNTGGLFQGSSSSSLRRQALTRAVEADNPGVEVAFMNEVII
jgi:hypothetical protein